MSLSIMNNSQINSNVCDIDEEVYKYIPVAIFDGYCQELSGDESFNNTHSQVLKRIGYYTVLDFINSEFDISSELESPISDEDIHEFLPDRCIKEIQTTLALIFEINSDMKYQIDFQYILDDLGFNERNQKIIFERSSGGKTLESLGKKYSMTRERIRQIVNKAESKLEKYAFKSKNSYWVINTYLAFAYIYKELWNYKNKYSKVEDIEYKLNMKPGTLRFLAFIDSKTKILNGWGFMTPGWMPANKDRFACDLGPIRIFNNQLFLLPSELQVPVSDIKRMVARVFSISPILTVNKFVSDVLKSCNLQDYGVLSDNWYFICNYLQEINLIQIIDDKDYGLGAETSFVLDKKLTFMQKTIVSAIIYGSAGQSGEIDFAQGCRLHNIVNYINNRYEGEVNGRSVSAILERYKNIFVKTGKSSWGLVDLGAVEYVPIVTDSKLMVIAAIMELELKDFTINKTAVIKHLEKNLSPGSVLNYIQKGLAQGWLKNVLEDAQDNSANYDLRVAVPNQFNVPVDYLKQTQEINRHSKGLKLWESITNLLHKYPEGLSMNQIHNYLEHLEPKLESLAYELNNNIKNCVKYSDGIYALDNNRLMEIKSAPKINIRGALRNIMAEASEPLPIEVVFSRLWDIKPVFWGTYKSTISNMTKDGELKTDELGNLIFIDEFKERTRPSWGNRYKALKEYKRQYGSVDVKYNYKNGAGFSLGIWCNNQRSAKKAGKLTNDQIEKLESLGFKWYKSLKTTPSRFDVKNLDDWETGFNAAILYKQDHGDLMVAYSYKTSTGFALGEWSSIQRLNNDMEELSEYQINKLDSIGFIW